MVESVPWDEIDPDAWPAPREPKAGNRRRFLGRRKREELAADLPISEESRLALEEDLTVFPKEEPPRPWMACADCFSPESCYNGDMDCP